MSENVARIVVVLALLAAVGVESGCATVRPLEKDAESQPRKRRAKKPQAVVVGEPEPHPEPHPDPEAPPPGGPEPTDVEHAWEEGIGSYYADSLAGNRTASGERYKPEAATCAHPTHKFGTILEVQVKETGATARCRVNDRGPFVKGRVVDVSKSVARDLGMVGPGLLEVRIRPVSE